MQPHRRSRLPFSGLVLILIPFFSTSCAWPAQSVSIRSGETQTPLVENLPNFNLETVLTPTDAPPLTSTPAPQLTQTQEPLPPDAVHTRYTLTARLDFARRWLSVEESVVFTNTSGTSLDRLVFLVEPNRYSGAFQLTGLAWEDGKAVDRYSLKNNRMDIPLREPLQTRERTGLSLAFELSLPPIPPPSDTTRPVPFGYTERQANLVDWFPFLPPYHPTQGWLAHDPWYYGEHQVYDVADFEVNFQVSPGGPPLVIAASAPAKQDGDWLRYRLEKARSFALSASPEYVVSQQDVGGITVLSYAFPFSVQASQAALQETAAALELYQDLFGPYPRSTLSVIEADFLDGMEYDGLYFLSRGFYNLYDGSHQGYLTAIAVHETAHQWWYAQVGNDQALEPWLDEALCTYSEKLFYERIYPDLVDWWWGFRVNFYQPEGPVNGRLYDFTGFRPYVNAVYLRGALFLEDLRQAVGDEAFFAFLKDYAAQNQYKLVNADRFFEILSKHTAVDVQSVTERYFR